jgi:DNA-binding transcriptional LysR family regulator
MGPSWQGLQLRHLAALQAVAEERSFSGAGHRLGYTQSAVSAQVRDLEICVGARLFERTRGSRTILLTEQGRILYRHAVAILEHLDAARVETDRTRREPGPVRPRLAQPLR